MRCTIKIQRTPLILNNVIFIFFLVRYATSAKFLAMRRRVVIGPGFSDRTRAGFGPNFKKNFGLISGRTRRLEENFLKSELFLSFIYSVLTK